MRIGTHPEGTSGELLERGPALQTLATALDDVSGGLGRLVFVSGEAGVGKTTLLRRFAERALDTRVLWGSADSLFTPRPLGPLLDVAGAVGGGLAEVVFAAAKPHDVHEALLDELGRNPPTVLVLEDLHWADEATLDVVRLLARRLDRCPALVVASYRKEELDRGHPLRAVLGDLATAPGVTRVALAPLSRSAVAVLAGSHEIDADELYRTTSGNPFFVTEVLAAAGGRVPETVRDAVLAHVARLSSAAQALVDVVALVPPRAEAWLLAHVAEPASVAALDECLASGILVEEGDRIAFRHELARMAVADGVPRSAAVALHRRTLEALRAHPASSGDLARLAHHAEGAGDAEAVLELAPAAAERAAALGAHREAAAQYARALRFADGEPLERRAELLVRHSFECYLTAQDEPALSSIALALACYRELGDEARLGATLRWQALALMNWGRAREAAPIAHEAVSVLERGAPGHDLAMAYAALAAIALLDEDAEQTALWASRASVLARRLGEDDPHVAADAALGAMEVFTGLPDGRARLEESLRIAQAQGLESNVGRTYVLSAMAASRERSLARMRQYVEPGLSYCDERDLDVWSDILLAMRAWLELEEGAWDAAAATVRQVLARQCVLSSTQARIVLGLLRARRGDPDPWTPLHQASAAAERTGQLWWTGQVAGAMAEAAWLEQRPQLIPQLTESAFAVARTRGSPWLLAELGYWRSTSGGPDGEPVVGLRGPFAAQLRGEWRAAHEEWARAGCPYEAAVALADGDETAQRHALADLNRLGARPAALVVARRLRERGARGLARGPRPATRDNPAQLTSRELEVVRLVAEGLRNAEIADRLVLSKRTVDHHVSAILRKLGVRTRGEAARAAARLAVVDGP